MCVIFSKSFFWFKQKAKEIKESAGCAKHTDYDSPLRHVPTSRLSLFEVASSIIKIFQSYFLSQDEMTHGELIRLNSVGN